MTMQKVIHCQLTCVLIFIAPFSQGLFLPFLSLSFLHFYFLDDSGSLLSKSLLYIEIVLVSFIQFTINNFLKLISNLLRYQIYIKSCVDKFISLQALQDLLRVIIIIV